MLLKQRIICKSIHRFADDNGEVYRNMIINELAYVNISSIPYFAYKAYGFSMNLL